MARREPSLAAQYLHDVVRKELAPLRKMFTRQAKQAAKGTRPAFITARVHTLRKAT